METITNVLAAIGVLTILFGIILFFIFRRYKSSLHITKDSVDDIKKQKYSYGFYRNLDNEIANCNRDIEFVHRKLQIEFEAKVNILEEKIGILELKIKTPMPQIGDKINGGFVTEVEIRRYRGECKYYYKVKLFNQKTKEVTSESIY